MESSILWIIAFSVILHFDYRFCNFNLFFHKRPHNVSSFMSWFQEWPEEDYPPYANGPGYILSSDIASFIVSEFEKHKLRVSLLV